MALAVLTMSRTKLEANLQQSDPYQERAAGAAESLSRIASTAREHFQTVEAMSCSFIRAAIMHGYFGPGERLHQEVIAEILGVSRHSVRASLRQLEGEGLVRTTMNRGTRVSVLHPKEIREIYELRALLEAHLLKLAAPDLAREDLSPVEGAARLCDTKEDPPDAQEFRHELLQQAYEEAHRPLTLALIRQLNDLVALACAPSNGEPGPARRRHPPT